MNKKSKTITAIAKRMLTGRRLNLTIAEQVAIRKWKFNQMPEAMRKVAAEIQGIRLLEKEK